MTSRLQKAIEKLKQLPAKEQNRFAKMVLNDLKWDETFERTRVQLDKLGESVLKEIREGKFK